MGNGVMRYSQHIANLYDTQDRVLSLINKLEMVKEQYKSKIDQSEANGFQPEYVDELRDRYVKFSLKINSLIEVIKIQNQTFGEAIDIITQLGKKAKEG